jgi:hypothetical protein
MMGTSMDDNEHDETAELPEKPEMTLGDLLDSDVVGMLADLDPELDSSEIARELRERAWHRFRR